MAHPIENSIRPDSTSPRSTRLKQLLLLLELSRIASEKKLKNSTSGVSKMPGPLVEVVTVPKPKKCSRCERIVPADGTAVNVNSVLFCKGCAFEVVKELDPLYGKS